MVGPKKVGGRREDCRTRILGWKSTDREKIDQLIYATYDNHARGCNGR